MPRAYWIANSDVADMGDLSRYRDANRDVMNRCGATFIVMHGQQRLAGGTSRSKQTLVEFPSYEAATACHDDPACHGAATIRHAIAVGDAVTYDWMRGRGAVVTTTYGALFELYPDLSSPEGQRAEGIAARSAAGAQHEVAR